MKSQKTKHTLMAGIAVAMMTLVAVPVSAQRVLTQQEKDSLQRNNRKVVLAPRITTRTVNMNDGTVQTKSVTSLNNVAHGNAKEQMKQTTTTSTLYDNHAQEQNYKGYDFSVSGDNHSSITFLNPDGSEVQGASTTFFGRITRNGQAVPGATLSILGKDGTATTDNSGMYRLEANFGDILWLQTRNGKVYASCTTTSSNRYDFMITDEVATPSKKESAQSMSNEFDMSNPLIVVDGKMMEPGYNINRLSTQQIKSLNVLKGEKAVAKYGRRANKGVIEITLQ